MSSGEGAESFPKEFQKTTEVLPFTKYGISSFEEFKSVEKDIQHIEWLKRAGLTNDEMKLYQDNEMGVRDKYTKLESSVLKSKIDVIYDKIEKFKIKEDQRFKIEDHPSTSKTENIVDRLVNKSKTFFPPGHPMNDIKQIEKRLFSHLDESMLSTTKRRKMLRRLERRKEKISHKHLQITVLPNVSTNRPGSLWDVKDKPSKKETIVSREMYEHDKLSQKETILPREMYNKPSTSCTSTEKEKLIGPKKQTMYTIKDNKIVRLEPTSKEDNFCAVDIVLPINKAEEELLEGTKMSIDDIRRIERFKDYEPGVPSKVLYVKNIAPSVTQEQLSIVFNQFVLENRGPVDIKLMSGRMRGQAFVSFHSENLALKCLEEVNGTVLCGRPIIVQFGRNTNRIQGDDYR